jgi:hypothetical protein
VSTTARIRDAVRRQRARFRYEVRKPELSLAEIYTMLAPGTEAELATPDGFQRLWTLCRDAMPRGIWSVKPAAPADAIDRARRGECRVLTRTMPVSPQTDWHADPYHHVGWPKVHVGSCPFSVPGGDLVLLWHLNRMSYLVDLVDAYRTSGDEGILARVYALLDSWAKENPYLVGANWLSPMETGLRLVAWSMAIAGTSTAPPPDEQQCERILRSVIRQATFLAAHFSRWPVPNNHLIGEAATLGTFATYWPMFKSQRVWLVQAETTLVEEAQRQVLKDGFHFENSVNYHLVVLDYFLLHLHAKLLRGEDPHPVILEKTRALADAALTLPGPSGRMPMIGDDSMPQFVVLAGTMGSPGPLAGKIQFEDMVKLEHALLFSTTSWGRELLALEKDVPHARRFHEAGIDTVRDEHAHLVFMHGPQHRHPYSNGHVHADAGSFELELDETPLIVDSGTYLYGDPGLRDHMRSAHAHNTVIIDGVEPMIPSGPFQWGSVASAEPLGFGALDDVMATGCRRNLPGTQGMGVEHARVFVRVGSTVIVADALSPREGVIGMAHTAAIYFHTTIAPGIAVRDGHCVRLTDEARFVRVFEVLDEPRAQLDLIDSSTDWASQYSNAYGEVTGGTTIRVSVPVQQTVVLVSVIRLPEVSVTRARARVGEVGCAISEPHGVRRIVSFRLDPFAVTVGGRVITGSGTAPATVHAPVGSSSLEWLDELDR